MITSAASTTERLEPDLKFDCQQRISADSLRRQPAA